MRNAVIAGVAVVALTLGGCSLFGSKSSDQTGANERSATPSTVDTSGGNNASRAPSSGASTPSTSMSSANMPSSGSTEKSSRSASHAASPQVKQAQQELQSAGLYNGKVDGIDGPETRQAVKSFQQKNNLPQTGKLDQQTMAALQSGSSSSGSSTPGTNSSGTSNSSGTQK